MSSQVTRKPIGWTLLDTVEACAATLWPFKGQAARARAFLLPAVLVVGILVIGLGYIIKYSFHELDITTYRLKDEYSTINYLTFLERPVYLRILGRTILASVVVTALTLALAFPYAYVLVRTASATMRKFLLFALFLPFFIGQVVRAYGWLIILGKEGLINAAVTLLGWPALDLIYTYPAVIFGLIQYMLPFAALLLIPAIAAISEEMELASEGLGAHWVGTFWHVVLPLAKPGLVGASVVVFTLTMTDFAMPEILGGGKTDFIASAIYDSFFQISNPGLGAALSVILIAVGSFLVTGIFLVAGTGTLGFRSEAG